MELVSIFSDWRELLAIIVAAWTLPVANLAQIKTKHLELPFMIPKTKAITLFPLVIYSKGYKTPCVVEHEKVHVKDVRKYGPLLFYVQYLYWLALGYRGRNHPMEVEGYAAEEACEAES